MNSIAAPFQPYGPLVPLPYPRCAIVPGRKWEHPVSVVAISQIQRKGQQKNMLQPNPKPVSSGTRSGVAVPNPQQGRLLFALVVLLIALAIVLVGDRAFWFGSNQSADSDLVQPAATQAAAANPAPAAANTAQPAPVRSVRRQTSVAQHVAAPTSAVPKSSNSNTVTTVRTVLPPLNVEVVAGNTHRPVHPGNSTTRLEIANPGAANSAAPKTTVSAPPAQPSANAAPATDAAERERMSTDKSASAAQPQQPSYPLLAQHMDVQGSVVLQALIGADGIIQDLRVLSGPGILASAAEQAVREWRFKPIYQNGQAVETQAKITVNFTIKVAGNSENPTLAESRTDGLLIFTR